MSHPHQHAPGPDELSVERLFGVSGKTAVVTGGSRGIGYMIAAGLVANGVTTYITARKAEACDDAAAALDVLRTWAKSATEAEIEEAKRVAGPAYFHLPYSPEGFPPAMLSACIEKITFSYRRDVIRNLTPGQVKAMMTSK